MPDSSNGTVATPVLRRFEERYRGAARLQATFLERYQENGRIARVESGNAYFMRPGRMRWDYVAPEKNTFLVDGKYVWFYAPADHTVTRMPSKQSEDWRTPLVFLTSHLRLAQICSKVESARGVEPSRPGATAFYCSLRESQNGGSGAARRVLFEVAPEGELNRIVIPQEGGIELEFAFAAWQWNPAFDKKLFQFVVPPNTVIVNGMLPETPGLRQ